MTILLYDCATAPSPRRARIILAEKKIPHDTVEVDLRQGEQLGAAFRAINPDATVPYLKLADGTGIFENWGIALWAEAEKPAPALLGTSPAERGLVASWASKIDFHGTLAFAEALRNGSPAMKNRSLPGPRNYPQVPALAERGQARFVIFKDTLNAHLEGRGYIAGEGFSIADIWALTVLDAARWIKAGPDDKHPHLLAWYERVSQRPSAAL